MTDYKEVVIQPEGAELPITPKTSRIKVFFTYMLIIVAGFFLAEQYILFSNFNDISFVLRRKDLTAAARLVDQEETKQVETKMKEVKEESVKRMLSPLVVADNK